MRNFWMTADIEGRNTILQGGPKAKDGSMRIEIRQRKNGASVKAFSIGCIEYDGKLITTVFDHGGVGVAQFETDR